MSKQKIIYSFDTLCHLVRDVKSYGKRIGLTHGAFDLFHFSHLDLLRKSSAVCDFLIVGVDSDRSVAQYKSYKRPIIGQQQRLRIIGELECVDAVFIKDISVNPQEHIDLYKSLMVDIITIGPRFEQQFKKPLEDEALYAGAQLIEIDVYQDTSTTQIINSIVTKYS